MNLMDAFKRAVIKPLLKTALFSKAVMPEMEAMGWSHKLEIDHPVFPVYEWTRPDGSRIGAMNLGHTEAPPASDEIWKRDWDLAKEKVAARILKLESK